MCRGDGRIDARLGWPARCPDLFVRAIAPLDDWVRIHLLPRLPSDAVTVLASRTPPTPHVRADPAGTRIAVECLLRNLSPRKAISTALMASICAPRTTSSHSRTNIRWRFPCWPTSSCVAVRRPPDPMTRLVGTLLRDSSRSHLPAPPVLDVCAVARVTTEALLRHALELDDALDLSPGCANCPSSSPDLTAVPRRTGPRRLGDRSALARSHGYRRVFAKSATTSTIRLRRAVTRSNSAP